MVILKEYGDRSVLAVVTAGERAAPRVCAEHFRLMVETVMLAYAGACKLLGIAPEYQLSPVPQPYPEAPPTPIRRGRLPKTVVDAAHEQFEMGEREPATIANAVSAFTGEAVGKESVAGLLARWLKAHPEAPPEAPARVSAMKPGGVLDVPGVGEAAQRHNPKRLLKC